MTWCESVRRWICGGCLGVGAAVAAACGGGGGASMSEDPDAPFSGEVTPVLDEARAVEAIVGPAGGTVTASAADGTVFSLQIPEGALLADETIRVTPLSDLEGMSDGLVAGVDFEPDGLVLWRPGRLAIELPGALEAPEGTESFGFAYEGAGAQFRPDLMGIDGATVTLGVAHFSGGGVGALPPADIATLYMLSDSDEETYFLGQLAALPNDASPAEYAALVVQWYGESVGPKLVAAASADTDTDTRVAALAEYVSWVNANGMLEIANVLNWNMLQLQLYAASGIDDLNATSLADVAGAIAGGYARDNATCAAEHSWESAEAAMHWHKVATALEVAIPEYGLELQTLADALCLQVIVSDVSFPQVPVVGQQQPLTLAFGPTFDGSTVVPLGDWTTEVFVEASGATESLIGSDEGTGFHSVPVTPTGQGELVLDAHACLRNPDFPSLSAIPCGEALVVRGLTVEPASIEVPTGGVVDFEALLFGEVQSNVTWSATDGTIESDGTFVAPLSEGTVTVTASTGSGSSSTAVVTVGEGCNADPRLYSVYAEDPDGTDHGTEGSPTPVDFMQGSSYARASGNTVEASHVGNADWYEFFAGISFGIALDPVDPADAGMPASVTFGVDLSYSGEEPDVLAPHAVGLNCSGGGTSVAIGFQPGNPDDPNNVASPGTYSMTLDTVLGSRIECFLGAIAEPAGDTAVIGGQYQGITNIVSAAEYTVCSN